MRFSRLYEDVKASDLFKPASEEEVAKRKLEYSKIRIQEFLKRYPSTKLDDGSLHVHSNLNMSGYSLKTLECLNISKVDGNFRCDYNELTSLEGGPKEVAGNFRCDYNELTSLEGGPKEVAGDFDCYNNELTDLKGAPSIIDGSFNCSANNLTSLEGAPEEIQYSFYCISNELTSLEGAPKIVHKNFCCSKNTKTFTKDEVRAVCDVKGEIRT